MNLLDYKGRLKLYLQMPIYMIVVFVIGNIYFYFESVRLGVIASIGILLYAIVVIIIYQSNKKRLGEEIVSFATRYGTVQKELLNSFELPYAILDSNGRIIWMNQAFSEISGKDKDYGKSVSTIFKEITKEAIEHTRENAFSVPILYDDKMLSARLQKMSFNDVSEEKDLIDLSGTNGLTTIIIFDDTEIERLRQENRNEKMVAAYLYIDNYDDIVDTVEDVKKSLLVAVIDREINNYFQGRDAIIRKTEKDKYFIVFPYKYLADMEEDKFRVLENIKNIKVGNESEVTLSIGIGAEGNDYSQIAENARAAINIALGRGGAQAVVKSMQDVSYYGIRGREFEKNTRVKARVKAQALREMMETRDNVIVMGHSISDEDAFGAAIGVYCAARELGKKAQIVLNNITTSLRPLVESFSAENGYPADLIINSEQAVNALTSRTLVMVVDTNKHSYTECPELIDLSRSVVVFDHHRQSRDMIENPLLSYIEPYASSTCEMIAEVLQYFSEDIELQPLEADCIYAGILIDTNNFKTKTGVRTFEAAAYLRRNGAEVTRVRKLLREDMSTYKARAEIVRRAEVFKNAFAISVCEAREIESPTVVGAQAANELLNIVGIKASFVLTEYQHKIYVSSRSIDEIDVQLIMERLGGGGHLNVAGAQIENSTVEQVRKRIEDILEIMIEEGELVLE